MYCIKCGADNSDTAVYCRKCGAPTEDETRVARRSGNAEPVTINGDDDAESEIFSIGPTLLFVKAGYAAAAVAALLLAAVFSAFTSVSPWIAVLIGLLLLLMPGYYHLRNKMTRYRLTETKLEIDRGFISRTTQTIPIRRIQDVTISSGLAERMLGFGDLMIDNASEDGAKIVLANINSPKLHSEILMKQMRWLER